MDTSALKTGAIILARVASARLPGKVLCKLADKPLLDHVIDRAGKIHSANEVVVATSTEPSDDPVVDHCRRRQVAVFRGSHDNVSARILECAQVNHFDYFARLNGDSPLLNADLIDEGLRLAIANQYDFVTNLCPRRYPYGISVEVFRTTTFQSGYERMTGADEFEHVSRYFYAHRQEFRYTNLPFEGNDSSHIRLAIDSREDLERIENLMSHFGDQVEQISISEIIRFCEQNWPVQDEAG